MPRPWPCLLLLSLWAALAVPAVRGDDAPPLASLLRRAEEFERQARWQQAADLYDRAVRRFQDTQALRLRWRQAESRHSLARRYSDASFRRDLLSLSEPEALGILAETVQKIQTHHVGGPAFARLSQAGYAQLALALDDPAFVEANVPAPRRTDVAAIRATLAKGPARPATNVSEVLEDAHAARQAAAALGLREAAPALEFVHAACEALDPYSAYLSPDRLRDLYSVIDGNFVGLGVEVRGEAAGLRIAHVLEGSPAAEAGLQDEDVIVEVDGQALAGLTSEQAANTLQGAPGSMVRLRLRRGASELAAALARREVVVRSVPVAEFLDPARGLAYLRISCFQKSTATELDAAVAALRNRAPVRAAILDLRGNPGGLLDVAVQVAGRFIPAGTLVQTRGPGQAPAWRHEAANPAAWTFAVAALVDSDSASASEILAGALQDHRRGLVVGERTYGKGSVQSIFPLQWKGTGLRLTTATFHSPQGRPYEGVGVTPDVLVARGSAATGEPLPAPRRPDPARDPQLRAAAERLQRDLAALAVR